MAAARRLVEGYIYLAVAEQTDSEIKIFGLGADRVYESRKYLVNGVI